jgi:NAD(P)-dependent dehydrogenase (short-subunit alcohol dehydrogenase family)
MATDVNQSTLAETASMAAELSPRLKIITQVADITQSEAVEGLIKRTVDEFGRLDYGFNVAGMFGNCLQHRFIQSV